MKHVMTEECPECGSDMIEMSTGQGFLIGYCPDFDCMYFTKTKGSRIRSTTRKRSIVTTNDEDDAG